MKRCLLALALAACGGKAGDETTAGSGSGSAVAADAAPPRPSDGAPPAIDAPPSGKAGELAVKVEWKDVPVAARSSPGRTPCNTPRAASVAPTTMFHIPEAFVFVEGVASVPAEARIRLADCALSPRVAVGLSLVLESASDRPAKVTIAKWGDARDVTKLAPGAERTVQLPIAGHTVSVVVEGGGVYRIATEGPEPEVAWLVAAPAWITEASGQVQVAAPPGEHAIRAFVPARGGQPARFGNGKAAVVAGDLVEVSVPIAP